MHYFITGATGLLGSHLVDQLVDDGHEVTGLTRSRSNAAHLPDEATIVEGDITDKGSMREAMAPFGRFDPFLWLSTLILGGGSIVW